MSLPIRVLFVCVANSARSQLAEALLRHTDPRFEAFSGGSEPSIVDSRTIEALEDTGIDASGLRSKSIDEFRDDRFDYVITLCDKAASECYAIPSTGEIIAWDFSRSCDKRKSRCISPYARGHSRTHKALCVG